MLFKDLFEKYKVHIDKNMLFWAFHFPYMESGEKTGTIRYKKDHIRLPFGAKLPVYETEEFNQGMPPRGIITIDYVVACQLKELNEEERGFVSQEELFEGMKDYYQDIKPDSLVSFYKFKEYNSNPKKKELKKLLEIIR